MATSGMEELSTRLLEAFYDLAQGRLQSPVSKEDAAHKADIEEDSTEPDVALRYLLNGGYLEAATDSVPADSGDETEESYVITVPGMDRVRQKRGL